MKFQFVTITKKIENIASKNVLFRELLFLYYKPIIKREIKLANINSSNRLLFIGGGYMPVSAVLYQRLSKAKITVIDNDPLAISSAIKLIDIMKLQEQIDIVLCDGLDSLSFDFDVVIIAMQVNPLQEVFNTLYNAIEKGVKIVVRRPKASLQKGYLSNELELESNDYINQCCFSNIDKTVLYVK